MATSKISPSPASFRKIPGSRSLAKTSEYLMAKGSLEARKRKSMKMIIA